MTYECFDLTIEDGIAHLRLNRPEKANSMVPSFWKDLPEAVNALSRDASARVLVISAEGRTSHRVWILPSLPRVVWMVLRAGVVM